MLFVVIVINSLIIFLTFFNFSLIKAADVISNPDVRVESISANSLGIQFKEVVETWHLKSYNATEYTNLSKHIGWTYPINSRTTRSVKNSTGGYKFTFTTNQYGLRVLPSLGKRPNHLIVAGESNTFGQGVSDTENTPYLLGKAHPNYTPYNYGICGGGPHNTLGLMQNYQWEKSIAEPTGKMIYIYYPAWMNERPIGTKNYLSWENGHSPWYELNSKDELIRKGIFRDRFLTMIFKGITTIDKRHWVGDLPKFNDGHFKLIAKIFQEMQKEYYKKFPKGEFVLLVSDSGMEDAKANEPLIAHLKSYKVNVKRIHQNTRMDDNLRFMDYHFNEKGQQMVADSVSEAVKL